MTEKAAAAPVAWLIRWTERDTPCSMLVDGDPGPAAEDETITPLYAHPPAAAERIALLEAERELTINTLELMGKGLAYENVTKAKTQSAGRALMEIARKLRGGEE